MGRGFGDIRFAGSKHAPVVFCLDVTGSMTLPLKEENGVKIDRMYLANDMIRHFFEHILSIYKAADAVEVAFVLFTHEIVMETDFVNIMYLSDQMFANAKKTSSCGKWELYPVTVKIQNTDDQRTSYVPRFDVSRDDDGTKIDAAVLHSYKKILAKKEEYDRSNTAYYAPHFILVTDGDPNDGKKRLRDTEATHKAAVNMVNDHAFTGRDGKNLVVPITVGIFDDKIDSEAEKRVQDYGENFKSGYFRVRDEYAAKDFKKAAEFLCKTVIKSLNLAASNLEDRVGTDEEDHGLSVEEIFGQ